ncbi:MAG: hypothetical protein WDM86_16685 [Rhizomicrobium sp.]
MNSDPKTARTDNRLAWIEPKVEQLDVGETAMLPGTGADGGAGDNTRS